MTGATKRHMPFTGFCYFFGKLFVADRAIGQIMSQFIKLKIVNGCEG